MKKFSFLTRALKILMGVALCVLLFSCDNFLNGSEFKEQLGKDIDYAKAKNISVQISPKENTGLTVPLGKNSLKLGYPMEINFSEAEGWSFLQWIAVSESETFKNGKYTEIKGVMFEDAFSAKTSVTVTSDSDGLWIMPLCTDRISVVSETPKYAQLGVARDTAITVEFSKAPSSKSFIFTEDEILASTGLSRISDVQLKKKNGEIWAYEYEGKTYFKNIELHLNDKNGVSVAGHFQLPVLDGKRLIIVPDEENPLITGAGATACICCVLLSDIQDANGVCMSRQKEWSYLINSTTAQKAKLNLTCTEGTGELLGKGTDNYNMGQTIRLEFTEAEGWQFLYWEYDDNVICVNDRNALKTTAFVLSESMEVSTIRAVCIPRLKIENFSPKYSDSGVRCDSPVEITFNKPVDEETVNLYSQNSTSGSIQIVNPLIEEEHFESFFTKSISEDRKTVTLTPGFTIRSLFKSDSDMMNFKVKLDSKIIKDTDGYSLEKDFSWTYRLNNSMESDPPVVKKVELYKPVEINKDNLTIVDTGIDENFEPLEDSWKFFSRNHIRNEVIFDFEAEDAGSGYQKLTLKETFLCAVDGTVLNTDYGETEIFGKEHSGYKYNLKSDLDGLVKLDFIFEDKAGNKTVKTFYVIKDTSIDSSQCLNRGTITINDRIPSEGKIKERLDYYGYDIYFNSHSDSCTYSVQWGYDQRYLDPVVPVYNNGVVFEFERDIHYDCWVKITVQDSVGNSFEVLRVLPVQPEIMDLKDEYAGTGNIIHKRVIARNSDYDDDNWYKNCTSKPYVLWRYKADENAEFGEYYNREICQPQTSLDDGHENIFQVADSPDSPGDGIYEIYMLNCLKYNEKAGYWGPLSEPFIFYNNYTPSNPVAEDEDTEHLFPDTFNVDVIKPELSASVTEVRVTLPDDFINNAGFSYGVYCIEDNSVYPFTAFLKSGKSYSLKLYAKSKKTGKIYYSDCTMQADCLEDNIPPVLEKEDYIESVCSSNKVFPFFYDAEFLSGETGMYYDSAKQAFKVDYYFIKKDTKDTDTVSIVREDLTFLQDKKVTAYLRLPSNYYNVYEDYSGKKKGYRTTLDFGNNFMESYYTLVLDLQDLKKNKKLYSVVVSNITYPAIPKVFDFDVLYFEGQPAYEFKTEFLCEKSFWDISFCYLTEDDYWIRDDSWPEGLFKRKEDGSESCNEGKKTISLKDKDPLHLNMTKMNTFICLSGQSLESYDCYHSLYTYVYPAYELKSDEGKSQYCKTKAVIPGLSGVYQIFYDAPCFAHTMVFPTNMLSEIDSKVSQALDIAANAGQTLSEEDALRAVWETKGRELGIKFINNTWSEGSSIYCAPLSEIESGYSYVTVFHFADGTSAMSEVKHK